MYISDAVSAPLLVGIRRPQILLPKPFCGDAAMDTGRFRCSDALKLFCGGAAGEELAFILEHEYTHYRRKDLWVKLLLALAGTLHWFNPFVYWMRRQAVQDMEFLCDSCVVKNFSREEKKQYGQALLSCASSEKSRGIVWCASEFSRDESSLKERLANLFSGEGKSGGF